MSGGAMDEDEGEELPEVWLGVEEMERASREAARVGEVELNRGLASSLLVDGPLGSAQLSWSRLLGRRGRLGP